MPVFSKSRAINISMGNMTFRSFNEFSVKNKMRKYLQTYDLEYMIEKLPWEIYNERKEKYNYE